MDLSSWALGVFTGVLLGFPLRRGPKPPAPDEAAKLRREEQSALINTLATGLAHELRNPISTLKINLQMLLEDWKQPVSDREQRSTRKLEVLLRETERLNSILDTFLRLAAGHKLSREPLDLRRFLEELLAFVGARAEAAGVKIRSTLPGPVPIQADAALLRQALLNLLLNAIEATPRSGAIDVALEWKGKSSWITISDTGPGIPADVLPRIFDIFYSTKPSGTGLGLPIAKKIIEEHEGSIHIESSPDRGTRVRVELPAS